VNTATFPVDAVVPALAEALGAQPCAVLIAEPGAGKTTRVPLLLRDAPWLKGARTVMLEPRRLAARAAAARMAATLGEAPGGTVGYTVRHERRVSAATIIEIVTEGILTRRLQQDPELAGTGLLIFDEFHERSLDGDLGLALALDVQRALRPDLKILVMSATLDAVRLSRFLGGAPVVETAGRMFPVRTVYLDKAQRPTIAADVARGVRTALAETGGSVLAFLPGEAEIRRTAEALAAGGLPEGVSVRPLYGALSFAEQDAAIQPAPVGFRKVVLATTIAETSLTIEGITAVVDCGFKRAPRFDPAGGMTALETVRVSMASAEQRRGRAGRLGPGTCYRLWPEAETRALAAFDPPEMLVADLAPLMLELAAWGVTDPEALSWLDPPPRAAVAQARELLQRLDALDAGGRINPTGRAMVRLPLHPRLAHMVTTAGTPEAAELAAFMSERGGGSGGADISQQLAGLRGSLRDRVRTSARQIAGLSEGKRSKSQDRLSPGVLVALAYPDRIAQRRGGDRRYRFSGGGGGILPEHDALAVHEWLAVATTDGSAGDQKIRLAAPLTLAEVEAHFGALVGVREDVVWDARAEAVTSTRSRRLGALVLEERPLTGADPDRLSEAMLAGVRAMGLAALPWTDAAQGLRARLAFLARTLPDGGWPDFSDAALAADLDWLAPYLPGIIRRSHLSRLDLLEMLRAQVPHDLVRRMDALAPVRVPVPSGADVRIDYSGDGDPVLRVRLQEMFGLTTTPRIAEGRALLRIELLSPAGRPIAVTQSLETFWTNGYPDVRAQLRGRYPKHAWPEDPISAPPAPPRRPR
jgi:ATP-dependent helicase HrpB